MEVLENILGILLLIFMGWAAYMSSHIISERKAGKQIPLPWEKKPKKRGRPPKKKK